MDGVGTPATALHFELYFGFLTFQTRGILFGRMVLELGDMCAVKCEQTNMVCDVEFKTKVGIDSVIFPCGIVGEGSMVAMTSGSAGVRRSCRTRGTLYGAWSKFGSICYLRCQEVVVHAGSFLGTYITSRYSNLPCAAGSFEILLVIFPYVVLFLSLINSTHPCFYQSLIDNSLPRASSREDITLLLVELNETALMWRMLLGCGVRLWSTSRARYERFYKAYSQSLKS